MFENYWKSLTQHCERSQLRLQFMKMPKMVHFCEFLKHNNFGNFSRQIKIVKILIEKNRCVFTTFLNKIIFETFLVKSMLSTSKQCKTVVFWRFLIFDVYNFDLTRKVSKIILFKKVMRTQRFFYFKDFDNFDLIVFSRLF